MRMRCANDGHWTRGSYDDGNGGRGLVCALLHLSRKYRRLMAPAMELLQDAMLQPGLPLVRFNDTHWAYRRAAFRNLSRRTGSPLSMRTESGPPPRLRPGYSSRSRKNERAVAGYRGDRVGPSDQPFASEHLAA
jgi:hypothetical protein